MLAARLFSLGARCMAAALLSTGVAHARGASDRSWIKDEKSADGAAQIYLSPAFTPVKGKYAAVPESMIDARSTIEGHFLMGSYRYVFTKPETGADGTLSDELVATEILDCKDNFFGTARQVRKYKGKVVSVRITPPADITMTQTTSPNIGSKLCALSQNRKAVSLQQKSVDNPGYNPKPTVKDIDRLIDKHAR